MKLVHNRSADDALKILKEKQTWVTQGMMDVWVWVFSGVYTVCSCSCAEGGNWKQSWASTPPRRSEPVLRRDARCSVDGFAFRRYQPLQYIEDKPFWQSSKYVKRRQHVAKLCKTWKCYDILWQHVARCDKHGKHRVRNAELHHTMIIPSWGRWRSSMSSNTRSGWSRSGSSSHMNIVWIRCGKRMISWNVSTRFQPVFKWFWHLSTTRGQY